MISLTIPWEALASDNKRHARRGGRGHGWAYKAAREAIGYCGLEQCPEPFTEPVWVRMDFHQPDNRRRDCSNFLKVIGDGLNKIVWQDDSLIKDMGYLVHPPDGTPARVDIRVGKGRHKE